MSVKYDKAASTASAKTTVTLSDKTASADSSITAPAAHEITADQANAEVEGGTPLSWTVKAGEKDIELKITLS